MDDGLRKRLIGWLALGLVGLLAVTWGPSWYRLGLQKRQMRLEAALNDPGASAERREGAWWTLRGRKAARQAAAIEVQASTPEELRPLAAFDAAALPGAWRQPCLEKRRQVLGIQARLRDDLAIDTRRIGHAEFIEDDHGMDATGIEAQFEALRSARQWLEHYCSQGAAGRPPPPPERLPSTSAPATDVLTVDGSDAFAGWSDEQITAAVRHLSLDELAEEIRRHNCRPGMSREDCEAFSQGAALLMKEALAYSEAHAGEIAAREEGNRLLRQQAALRLRQECASQRELRTALEAQLQQEHPPRGERVSEDEWEQGRRETADSIRQIDQFLARNCSP